MYFNKMDGGINMKIVCVAALLIFLIIALLYNDNIRFWTPIKRFEWMANEFVTMYKILLPKVKDILSEEDDCFFEGEYFNETFEKGDMEEFYNRMKQCAELVIKTYSEIPEESFETVDEEMYEILTKMHEEVLRINHEIRLADWKN